MKHAIKLIYFNESAALPNDGAARQKAARTFEQNTILKMKLLEKRSRKIMHVVSHNLNNDHLNDTPKRAAKMYVRDIMSGLNPSGKPEAALSKQLLNHSATYTSNKRNSSKTWKM